MIEIIGVIMIGAVLYTFIKCLGTPSKNSDKRHQIIENKIESLGSKVIKIESIKTKDYPYYDELNMEDGTIHIIYKIKYIMEGEEKEGWGLLKLRQSILVNGATNDEWFWKLQTA